MRRTGEVVALYKDTIVPELERNVGLLQRAYEQGEIGMFTALQGQERFMRRALKYRKTAVAGALAGLAGAAVLFPRIGREFMPVMDEGTTVVIIEKLPSISLERSLELDVPYQNAMMELPEVIGVGLIPLLFATGPGSELQRPLAVVVIGGLFTSTLLTLVLLPTLYAWLEKRVGSEWKPAEGGQA